MQFFNKDFQVIDLQRVVNGWKLKNNVIVFTNGCFDILHPGHVAYLHDAKALGHRLVIGLNTDNSVRRLDKAPNRPLNNQDARMSVLAALGAVDAIVLFDEDTPLELIKALQPDVLVKGGDYNPAQTDRNAKDYIVGSHEVREWGGRVVDLAFLPGYSTTSLIDKIRK